MRTLSLFVFSLWCAAAMADDPPPAEGAAPAPKLTMPAGPLGALMERVTPVIEAVSAFKAVAPAAPAGEPMALDLGMVVETALRQNAKALQAAEDLEARRAAVGQAKAARRPVIDAQAAYAYIDGLEQPVELSGIAQRFIGGGGLEVEKQLVQLQVGIQQPIYAGGAIRAGIKASEYLAASEAWKRQATLDQIELDAKQAYYDCLLSLALIEVARESVKTFERHRTDAEQMLNVGMASRFELLRAQTELGARETDRVSADSASEIAFLNLRRLLGIEDARPVVLTGTLEWRPLADPVEAYLDKALAARPELRALDEGINAAEQRVELARAEFRPKLGASVRYQEFLGGPQFLPDGASVFVQGQYDLYAGGKRRSALHQAEAEKRSLEHQRTDVRRLIELDVRQAHIRTNEAIETIRRETGTVALAEEGLRLSELRFEEGVGTPADTLNAELALTQARTSLARALRNYAVAMATLDRATGVSLIGRDAIGAAAPEETSGAAKAE